MKKVIMVLMIVISCVFNICFSYTQIELDESTAKYKTVILEKIWSRLDTVSDEKLEKMLLLIEDFTKKYDQQDISDSKKLQKISILNAFKQIITKRLENNFSDIVNILDSVSQEKKVIIINDKRCWDQCNTEPLIKDLQGLSSLNGAVFIEQDFSEVTAQSLLNETGTKFLPAAFFLENSIIELKDYLRPTASEKYFLLETWANYDPYTIRSSKWFKILDPQELSYIRTNPYIKWNKNAEILWLEYTDMECPFCAKLHNQWTLESLEEKYWDNFAHILNHFPLDFHKNAFTASQYMECVWKIQWSDSFYFMKDKIFSSKDPTEKFIIETAIVDLWISNEELIRCVDSKEFDTKISDQQKKWTELFWVTWTPGNVIINTYTGEYKVISWAYPTATFEETIDALMK